MNMEDDLDRLETYLGFEPATKSRQQKSKVSFFKRLFGRKKKTDEWR